jgi:hypothetical protein
LVPFSNGCHHQNPKHSLSIAIMSHNHKTTNLNSCISLEQQKELAYIIQNTKGGKQKRSIGQGVGWWRIVTPHLRAAANAMMMTETRGLEQQQQQ